MKHEILAPGIEIYQGDCRDIMPTFENKQFDLVLTDPPYNINFNYFEYEDNLSDDDYIKLIACFQNMPLAIIHYPEETMRYFVPALGVPDEVIVWCYNSNLPKQSRLINFYNLVPNMSKVKQPYKNPEDKRIQKLINKKESGGARLYDWFNDIQIVKNVSGEKSNHPCPVPVELMKRIILLTTSEDDIVLDPFLGSGTTLVACVQTGRRGVGIEIGPEYYDMAKKRIIEVLMQPRLL